MVLDFAFAFNNAIFSDRLLRIEITESSTIDSERDCKRRRLDNNTQPTDDDNDSCSKLMTTELHICSAILAAQSPFFFKLFTNGMLESEQRHVTLKMDASEKAAVMELLNFMYGNSLSVTAPPALLDVLMAADKFEVASCIKYCSRLLLNTPVTVDFALRLLDLPSSLLATDTVKPLTKAARQFLVSHYKDLNKFSSKEIMALTLVGIETILASDDLEIMSEDHLYDTVLEWAKTHYSDLEERQEILGSRLAHYIRFPHMTCSKLKEILASNDFRSQVASSLVLEALFFKAESMTCQRSLPAERAYKYKPIQIVNFVEAPRHRCIVYLDLKRKECAGLNPYGQLSSQQFQLGGHGFVLDARCILDTRASPDYFGLFLRVLEKGAVNLIVDYESATWSKTTNEFVRQRKGKYNTGGNNVEFANLFLLLWEKFIATDSPYFINDVLHLRVDLSIRL